MNLEIVSGAKRKIYIVSAVIILMAIIVEIWTVNRLSTFGQELNKLDQQKAALQLNNQVLQNEIAQDSSLQEISNESKNLGLQPIAHIQYLKPSNLASAQ